jgi:hypothetical protein
VLLFPAWSEARASLLAEARAYHDLGLDVLLVDLRGTGGSDGDTCTLGVREALDVSAAAAHADAHLRPGPTILHGRSLGAVSILRAIHEGRVRPDALVLESPFDSLFATVGNRCAAGGLRGFRSRPCSPPRPHRPLADPASREGRHA